MVAIIFSVSVGNGQPIYRQIVEQVKAALASGRLKVGDKLPTHRDLARELVVAPLTIKKAYDLLTREGLITQSQGRGTFITNRTSETKRDATNELSARTEALVRQAQLMGISPDELEKIIKSYWKGAKHG